MNLIPNKKNKDIVGVYIDISEISISHISLSGNQIKINKINSFKTNFPVKDKIIKPIGLNNEFFNEKQEWVSVFKETIKKMEISSFSMNITLSHYFSITRFFVMPIIDKKFWDKSIPIESKKYVPVAFDEMSYDFYAYPLNNIKKLAVLFGITQKKTVEFLISILNGISIEMDGVETSAISFERLLTFVDNKDHDKKAYIHFCGENSYVIFSSNNCPVIFREISIEDNSGISERKSLDIKGSIAFVKRYIPDQIYSTIIISGDNAQLWQKLAESESGLKAELIDINKILGLKNNSFSYLCAIGAALKDKITFKQNVDISGITLSKKLSKLVQNYIVTLASIISGFFLILSLFNHIQIYSISSKINSLKNTMTDISEFQNLPEDMVKTKVEDIQKKASLMKILFSEKDYLATKLHVIANVIPNDLWVTDINYINSIGMSDIVSEGREFNLRGETILKGDKKLAVVDSFVREIKKSPEFKSFMPPLGTIEASIETNLEKEVGSVANLNTPYSIICAEKKKRN